MKTHYASVERANESDNHDYWSDTACGLEYTEAPMTDDWKYVTCKKCLQRKEQYQAEMKVAMEHNCKDMGEFVEFMEREQKTK